MTKKKNQIHVVKDSDNTWSTRRGLHSKRALSRSKTQVEAIGRAVTQAKREGNTEVIVHGSNGGVMA